MPDAASTQQQQQQPVATAPDLGTAAAALLAKLQGVMQQLSALDDDDDAQARSQLLQVGPQLAAAHSQLHQAVAAAGDPAAQDRWRRQLAEYTLCTYEDEMEAQGLHIYELEAKFKGDTGMGNIMHSSQMGQLQSHDRVRCPWCG
jgi:hypothetical protein